MSTYLWIHQRLVADTRTKTDGPVWNALKGFWKQNGSFFNWYFFCSDFMDMGNNLHLKKNKNKNLCYIFSFHEKNLISLLFMYAGTCISMNSLYFRSRCPFYERHYFFLPPSYRTDWWRTRIATGWLVFFVASIIPYACIRRGHKKRRRTVSHHPQVQQGNYYYTTLIIAQNTESKYICVCIYGH